MRHAFGHRLRAARRAQERVLHRVARFFSGSRHAAGEAVKPCVMCVEQPAEALGGVGPRRRPRPRTSGWPRPIIVNQLNVQSSGLVGGRGAETARVPGRRRAGPRTRCRAHGSRRSPGQIRASRLHRRVHQRLVQRRRLVQRAACANRAGRRKTQAERERAREDATGPQLAAEPFALLPQRGMDGGGIRRGRWRAACSSMRAGGSAVRRIRLASMPAACRASAAPARPGEQRQLRLRKASQSARAAGCRRRAAARASAGSMPGQHLDLERGEEARLVSVEHVDDAARAPELRSDPRDQLRSRDAARRRRSRAPGLLRECARRFQRRCAAARAAGTADEHFVDRLPLDVGTFRAAGARRRAAMRRSRRRTRRRGRRRQDSGPTPARAACRREFRTCAPRATPRRPCRGCPAVPPMTTGRPTSSGRRRRSTATKNESRSRWATNLAIQSSISAIFSGWPLLLPTSRRSIRRRRACAPAARRSGSARPAAAARSSRAPAP